MEPLTFVPGDAPLLMSIPHVGEVLPPGIAAGMTPAGRAIGDTDWALDRLYDFARPLGLPVLRADYSRYVIDLNRDPDGKPLYPGASNTELVPTASFLGQDIYLPDRSPSASEIAARKAQYWQPYHDRLSAELAAIRTKHGYALLFDCHSIRSVVPRFFDGVLPDFNLGTAEGASCNPALEDALAAALSVDDRYSLALNGRFKGGYITRHYGAPAAGIHAFQFELSTRTYMDETPSFAWREDLAARVRPSLRRMIEAALAWGGDALDK